MLASDENCVKVSFVNTLHPFPIVMNANDPLLAVEYLILVLLSLKYNWRVGGITFVVTTILLAASHDRNIPSVSLA